MRIISALLLGLLAASCASQGPRDRGPRPFAKPEANPSAVVAAELRFARLAQEKGQWTAFRETATDDAVMLQPGPVNAQEWLKDKADPTTAVDWQPHKIYISCDGTLAASTGAWQGASGATGYFVTVWQKQHDATPRERRNGEDWKWVFDHGEALDKPLAEPDFVETEVANCDSKKVMPKAPTPSSTDAVKQVQSRWSGGRSADDSLVWAATITSDGTRKMWVGLMKDDGYEKVIDKQFPAAK